MGCSDCGARGGCDDRKGGERVLLDEVIARVYPDRTWGRPDDEARFQAGISQAEARRLGRSIAALAQAPVWFRAGEPEDLCDFLWVLCVGRRPSLLEVRDGEAAVGEEAPLDPGTPVEEKYLRVALSSVARIAAMQEVTIALSAEADEDGVPMLVAHESARPGVFNPVLLKRVQKIVAFLEASEIAHVDFGLLDVPLEGAAPGDYEARYGVAPKLANFLFQAAPATASRITLVEAPPMAASRPAAPRPAAPGPAASRPA